MDKESHILVGPVPDGVPGSYRARANHFGVPHSSILHHRARGRPSIESEAQRQQYLTPAEEEAVVSFVLQMSALGYPVRIRLLPSLAFSATRIRPVSNRPLKPPGKNWARSFQKRHPELHARRVQTLNWNGHEKNA
nr:hypothetical protein CFP56_11506 [Quercus suber]